MKSSANRLVAVLLLVGIAVCAALLPWGRWFGKSLDERLTERIAEYVELRKAEDWPKIYERTSPVDREAVSMQRFLILYGSGAIRTIALTEKARAIDAAAGTAQVKMELDGEVRLERLPAAMRQSLAPHDASARRQTGDFDLKWEYRDGDWWLRMDREAVTGRTEDGKPITTTGG